MEINWTLTKKIAVGLTNDNYYYKDYIIRKSKLICHPFLNHKTEQLVLNFVANLNVPVIAYFQEGEHFIYVTKHIKPSTDLQAVSLTPVIIKKVAQVLKTLHKTNLEPTAKIPIWDWNKQLHRFKNLVPKPVFNLTNFATVISNFLKTYQPTKITLCHNDLVPGNILLAGDRTYLIDYEYAMQNDPLFDIASFISETLYADSKLSVLFLKQFKLKASDLIAIHWWIHYQNLIWCYWANYLWSATGLDSYFKIMTEKYRKLQENINNPNFYDRGSCLNLK